MSTMHGRPGRPAPPLAVHRSPVSRPVAVAWWVVCLLLLLDIVHRGRWPSGLDGALVLGLAAVFAYAVYWRPEVVADSAGVQLRNPLRDIRLPWTRVTSVGGRWGLEVRTEDRTFTAFAAAPRRRPKRSRRGEVVQPGPSPVGEALVARWEAALAAGNPSEVALAPEPAVQVRWAWEVLVPGVLLVVALVVVAVVG